MSQRSLSIVSALLLIISSTVVAQKATVQVKPKPRTSTTTNTLNTAASSQIPAPSVNLSWTAGAGDNAFNAYRSNSLMTGGGSPGSGSGAAMNTAPITISSYSDSNVAWGSTYYYAVTGLNTATCPTGYTCESNYSNVLTVALPANPIPSPPVLNTATLTAGVVKLNWTEEGEYSAFRVYRKPPTLNWYQQIATGVTCCSYTDKSVKPGTYQYEIFAVNRTKIDGINYTFVSQPSNRQGITVP